MIQLAYIVIIGEIYTGWRLTEAFSLLYCLTGIILCVLGRRMGAWLFAVMWYTVLHGKGEEDEIKGEL